MRKALIGVVALVAIGLSVMAFSGPSSSTELQSGALFLGAYQKAPDGVLIDVRTPGEYATGHISGAINVDFENPNFTAAIRTLDMTKPYFVYCRSGNRSRQAVALMKQAGFTQITELRGGIAANQSALTLVTNTPPSV